VLTASTVKPLRCKGTSIAHNGRITLWNIQLDTFIASYLRNLYDLVLSRLRSELLRMSFYALPHLAAAINASCFPFVEDARDPAIVERVADIVAK
jgi:hypothetical protein